MDIAVYDVTVVGDKILINGRFTTVNGVARTGIARLNADGTLDTSFTPPALTALGDPIVDQIAVQSDGKIVIVGRFTSVGGLDRTGVARLHANGTHETSFEPPALTFAGGASNLHPQAVVILGDGKILIGGDFSEAGGEQRKGLVLLNANGSLAR